MQNNSRKKSALKFILLALIPYSRQNLLLSFSPNRFFNELEKQTGYSQKVLKESYKRGQTKGFIDTKKPELTRKGYHQIQPFVATKLKHGGRLMVIFDVPEETAAARRRLRDLLKTWRFDQVQKSVWVTDFDYHEALIDAVGDLELGGCVEIYESARLFPSTN